MKAILRPDHIVYATNTKDVIVQNTYRINRENIFREVADYKEAISLLEDGGTYIIHYDLFALAGFVEAFQQYKPSAIVYSDLYALAYNTGLSDGNYTCIDIDIAITSILDLTIQKKEITVDRHLQIPTTPFLQYLNEKIRNYLNTTLEKSEIAGAFFSNYNAIRLNDYILNPKYGIGNDKEMFDSYTLHFKESPFRKPCTDLTVLQFNDCIAHSIFKFIENDCKPENSVLIKSPITSYIPIKELLHSEYKINCVNELDFLNITLVSSPVYLDCYNIGWVYAEVNDLSYELQNVQKGRKSPLQFDITELQNDLSDSLYQVGNTTLVKYMAEIKQDYHGNLLLKIQTKENKVYYKSLTDK